MSSNHYSIFQTLYWFKGWGYVTRVLAYATLMWFAVGLSADALSFTQEIVLGLLYLTLIMISFVVSLFGLIGMFLGEIILHENVMNFCLY